MKKGRAINPASLLTSPPGRAAVINNIRSNIVRPSIIFATAEYVKRLREECLRENKPLHRHTRFRRQELAQDEINPDVRR